MYSLIVKGNKYEAAKAAADHNVPFVFERETVLGETVGHTPDTSLEKLMTWYAETNKAPFPVGTLLLWSKVKED